MRALWMVVLFLAAGPAVAADPDGGTRAADSEQVRRDAEQRRRDAEARRREEHERQAEQKERAREAREEAKEREQEQRDREHEIQQNVDETVRQAMEHAREEVAHAREQMQAAMNQMRVLSHEEHGRRGARPRIGVLVREDGGQDAQGAYIEAVTPGSPAEKAGIKAGDVLTSLDGKPLNQGHPMSRLVEAVRAAKPGSSVVVNLLRGKSTAAVNVAIPEGQGWAYDMPPLPPLPPMPPTPPDLGDVGFTRFSSRHLSEHWRDMDLVALNPELGEYFGAKEGVLVLKAPADATLPLKAGDVILKVGDRQPTSPSQVVRILRSYEPGESFKVELVRKKDRQTLTGKIPES
jgi:C-terminal processing protease CtpA/Prc